MKVMWMTFAPIGRAAKVLYGAPTQSGGWVDGALAALLPYIKEGKLSLEVVALDSKDACVADEETGVCYRTVNVERRRGKRGGKEDARAFKAVIDAFCPDVIQVWGTEFTFGLDVIEAAGDIPVCFFIQGVMASLAKHPLGDVPVRELRRMLGPTAFFKFRSLKKWHKINKRHVAYETEMVSRSAGLLADNDWTLAQYRHCTDHFYYVPLVANACFSEQSWDVNACERHTLFTVAGGICPQKGVHEAVLAVAQLKEKYPDIKLYIPGAVLTKKPTFLYDSVFIRHIRKLIAKHGLQENVFFTGKLSPQQMAERMRKANAFLMPSCVETHSSSLREAMLVGVPCVSAAVGTVPELLRYGENGFLYRYGEPEMLAYCVDKLFSDDGLATRIGAEGKRAVNGMYPQHKAGEMIWSAYEKMASGGRENE